MLTTLYKNKNTGVFQERAATLVLQIKKEDKDKNVGRIILNLADYIENPASCSRKVVLFEKCPDKGATIDF